MLTTRRIENPVTGEAILFGYVSYGYTSMLRHRDGKCYEFASLEEANGVAEQWKLRGDNPVSAAPNI